MWQEIRNITFIIWILSEMQCWRVMFVIFCMSDIENALLSKKRIYCHIYVTDGAILCFDRQSRRRAITVWSREYVSDGKGVHIVKSFIVGQGDLMPRVSDSIRNREFSFTSQWKAVWNTTK